MKIFFSTGEVSGDRASALLARELQERCHEPLLFGIGGRRMADAGVRIDFETRHLGVIGLTEALSSLPSAREALRQIRRQIEDERPQVAVLVGNDVFNVLLARWLRRKGIPTVSLFPPQVWLWRALARPIGASFDRLITSFPEEYEVYQRATGRAEYVGHYLCDLLDPVSKERRADARSRFGLSEEAQVVCILPGSRPQEIETLSSLLLSSAAELKKRDPALRLLLPIAEPEFEEKIRSELHCFDLAAGCVVTRDSHEALRASDLAILASGTASLEAALLGVPMVLAYRISSVTLAVVRTLQLLRVIRSDRIGLPNLILDKSAVPELMQSQATCQRIADLGWSLLQDSEERQRMLADLAEIRRQLQVSDGSLAKVADGVLALASSTPATTP
jgi:lipid-A-disaccharide synthase